MQNDALSMEAGTPMTQPAVDRSATSIPARFAEVAARHADRIAIRTPRAAWTYAELDQRSNAVAWQILARAGATECVALVMEHEALLIAGILGVLKAGKIYLALDPADPAPALKATLADSRSGLLLTDKLNSALAHSLGPDQFQVLEIPAAAGNPAAGLPKISPAAGAWLMYTSGSTGRPKGVWQNHHGAIHHADVYAELIELEPDDRLSLLTSCHLAASATALFAALLNGATLCPFHVRTEGVDRLAPWLRDQSITVYHSVPTVFRHLLQAMQEESQLESLRWVRLGGEPVFRTDAAAFQKHFPADCRLMHALSSTETGLISAWTLDKKTPLLPETRVPVGYAVRGAELLLLDERQEPVRAGDEGLIAVRSAHLAQGYWQRPEATAEAFRADPRDRTRRVFVTGDLGRCRPDGCLEHLGRVDRQVKIRGRRVDLNQVENALAAMDSIREVAVDAPEEKAGERRLVAHVVTRSGLTSNPEILRRELRTHLPEHLIPSIFITLPRLPQTPGGKIDRQALPAWQTHPSNTTLFRSPPRDHIEMNVARIWESVLGVTEVGVRDDFFDLGGDSLQSAQILFCVQERFGAALPPSTLFQYNTVEKLAALIASHAVFPSTNPLVPLRVAPAGRPLFFVHNGNGDVTTYVQLARLLSERPIYGLQAIGLDGKQWPLRSIRAMAGRYLSEILAADPTGPYLLASTCVGGLVAFEIACQLVKLGRPVGLLALMDTSLPTERSLLSRACDSVRDGFRVLRGAVIRALEFGPKARWLPAYRRFIARMNSCAAEAYRPDFYPGTATLFLTTEKNCRDEDNRLRLGRCARETRITKIAGSRPDLFAPPMLNELARQFQSALDDFESARINSAKP
jgi:amino acid adenylation domain-containing protein